MKIINTIKELDDDGHHSDFLNNHETVYIRDMAVKVHQYVDSWHITDLTHALARGKSCRSYAIKNHQSVRPGADVINWVRGFNFDFRAVIKHLDALDFNLNKWGGWDALTVAEHVEVYRQDIKAIRVFSPFALERLKPLKTMPDKWTLTHALRLLVNGQYEDLRCDGHYTDDYAYDNAVNFDMGLIANGRAFARRILESPSGWWCSYYDNRLHVCCHSFDSNSLIPVLGPTPPGAVQKVKVSKSDAALAAILGTSYN